MPVLELMTSLLGVYLSSALCVGGLLKEGVGSTLRTEGSSSKARILSWRFRVAQILGSEVTPRADMPASTFEIFISFPCIVSVAS